MFFCFWQKMKNLIKNVIISISFMEQTHIKLFQLVSVDIDNEREVCEILKACFQKDPDQTKIMVNTPHLHSSESASLLMWAVWTLKKDVVKGLLDCGADPKYVNENMQSVSTYWNCFPKKPDEDKASEIATLLHNHGADLLLSYAGDWSIVRKAQEYELNKLRATLESLDPVYKKIAFFDCSWNPRRYKKY